MTITEPASDVAKPPLTPEDELVLPFRKAMIVQHAMGESGLPEVRIYHAGKEVIFDEPDLFGFAVRLGSHPRFRAGEAVSWSGAGWSATADALEALVDAGVIVRAEALPADAVLALRPDDRPSPLPPADPGSPRSWAETEAVMAELTGQPLDAGYLELVVPIFRVAHPSLDADGRQVGEGNVFPKALRLDTPTDWRTSIYPGSRYQADRPMNVSALRAMREHWGPMMAVLTAMRAAYLRRCPEAAAGWTVGRLERLATCVLALPTYQLMRTDRRVASGALHPVLSNVFRVTDGLRMALHQMLFVPIGEPAWAAHAPVSAADIHAYAERNYTFHSEHGVCAGPRIMVEEFLTVLIDGAVPHAGFPDRLDVQVEEALRDVEAALDYGFLGLQAYGAVFSLWPAMTRAYEALHASAAAWAETEDVAAVRLRDRLAAHVDHIRFGSFLGEEPLRRQREVVYDDMYGQCEAGLSGATPAVSLLERLDDATIAEGARRDLMAGLKSRFPSASGVVIARLADDIGAFLARAQAVIQVAEDVQRRLNARLGRREPAKPFNAWDLDLHNRLLESDRRRLPYLFEELRDVFGLAIELDTHRLTIRPIGA